jgi:hypothetical protein
VRHPVRAGRGLDVRAHADDAWPHFRGWRVSYEAPAYAIAHLLNLPPAPWSGPRRSAYSSALPPTRPPHRAPDGSKIRALQNRAHARK